MKERDRRIRDLISTIIAYAVILGPIIILIFFMTVSYFTKIWDTVTDRLPIEKKVYYTIDGEYYHDSRDCPELDDGEQVYKAYKEELTDKTPCEQCCGGD